MAEDSQAEVGNSQSHKAEAIDAALCHGWIDGQLAKYDEQYWLIRFTARKPRSKWSEVNRMRAIELINAGKVVAAGLAEIESAKADGRWDAAYAPASRSMVPPDLQTALDANRKASAFFATLTGANRYAVLYRIGTVKKPETRARKIAAFVSMLERGETFHGLDHGMPRGEQQQEERGTNSVLIAHSQHPRDLLPHWCFQGSCLSPPSQAGT